MFMPFVVILPGIAALALAQMNIGYSLPAKAGGGYDYDQALTTLMAQFYPSGMLGVGLTALMASFMSGMAGNVTAFNTVWTYDIYQSYIRRDAPDLHYLTVGRITTVVGIALSIGYCLSGAAIQQHHGFAAACIRVRQRSAVCNVFARDVLEANHGTWRVRGFGERYARRYRDSWPDGRREQRRLDRILGNLPVDDGAELLDCNLCLDDLFCCNDPGKSRYKAEIRFRAS